MAEYTLVHPASWTSACPPKFHLTYVDKDGSEKTPVRPAPCDPGLSGPLHGLPDRGDQGQVPHPGWHLFRSRSCPFPKRTLEYAESITEKLVEAGVRVALDDDNQKIGYKIRAAQQVDRVPYMLVLGAKEAEAGNLSVRDRKGETTTMEVDEFIAKVTEEIKTRSYNA